MTQSAAGLTILSNTVAIGTPNLSAFGDLMTAENTPLVQMDFVYGINTQTGSTTVANSATADTNAGRLRLQSGTNSAGSASFISKRPAKYRPGQGITARFTTAFTTGVASSTQIVGMGNTSDGYLVGYNGTSFGMLHRNGGSDTWVAKTAWNGDRLDGTGSTGFTIDPTKGNVWQIKYPFLGYGAITLWCLDPGGTWLLCHTIRYPNSTATIQLGNPNQSFYAQSVNSGATTNQTLYVGSVGVFLNGTRSFVGSPRWGADGSETGVTSEVSLLQIRNATTYNGVTNRSLIRLNAITVGAIGGANSLNVFRFKLNATMGGSPSWSAINGTTADSGVTITSGNSVASVDTAGTYTSGGLTIFNTACVSGATNVIDLTGLMLFIAPGDILTITGTASVSSSLVAAINWSEDI